ncbi:MAG: hypothetical protein QOD00_1675 [Blastocatellia bacterium]|jgi:hypothetical protein|nr:hypothetical protein [Blastocatellia bacterium]
MSMSEELHERRWSVLSERGCEASKLVYDEAAQLVERLKGEKIHGLCIITDEAARRAVHQDEAHRVSTRAVRAQRR